MSGERLSTPRRKRRGNVLVMVISLLATLFILGASLLIVVRFERQTVIQEQAARQIRSAAEAAENRILHLLREDIVGADGIPYNGR